MCQRRVPLQAGAKPPSEAKAPGLPCGAVEGGEGGAGGQVRARLLLPSVQWKHFKIFV